MKEEVEKAVRFISRLVNRDEKLSKKQLRNFAECLTQVLCERYAEHWYPEKPVKGQAYRCIRINRKHPVDEFLLQACKASNLDYSELSLPREVTIWIDPGEVSCRLGENSHFFRVTEPDCRRGKITPTSDYHSESPSEYSSEDEGSLKRGGTPGPSKGQTGQKSGAKQGAQYFYAPTAPLWVPFPQSVISYIPAYQPVSFFYYDLTAKRQFTKTSRPKPNPNLVKRLTHRASKA
uniref:Anti-proliferative protein domain-containing protein n=1 Tax=Salvator merianae TaxID=96440 RepID=A0A8D0BD92_SALMN